VSQVSDFWCHYRSKYNSSVQQHVPFDTFESKNAGNVQRGFYREKIIHILTIKRHPNPTNRREFDGLRKLFQDEAAFKGNKFSSEQTCK